MDHAKDLMTTNVITVAPETSVADIAKVLLDNHISAVPVVDANNKVLGMVSEGDLMSRADTETDWRPSWWLSLFGSTEAVAQKFIKTHGTHAAEVMTRSVVTIASDTPVKEIARLLEKNGIKRVPVVDGGQLVGVVGRGDLLRGLATHGPKIKLASNDDRSIREKILAELKANDLRFPNASIVVSDGVVHLWGAVQSDAEREALRVAAEDIDGVSGVEDHLGRLPGYSRTA
jgi:CBS domain-containing protein